jgi:hypothetical protein
MLGKKLAKELKEKSPKRTGKYAKGWRSTVRKESAVGAEVVVHNKIYRLTHLLEKGHAKRGGGKSRGHSTHRSGRRRDHREAIR